MSGANQFSMPGLRRLAGSAVALAAVLLLGGCDTFGIGAAAPPAPALRPLDVRTDDLASLIVALDLPPDVQPVENANLADLDISTSSRGARHIKATLVLADGDSVDGGLPPLPRGHTYYLLGFSPKDQAAVAAAQKWLAALPPQAAPVSVFTVTPKLCSRRPVDGTASTFTIEAALPGGPPLLPLRAPTPLVALNGGKPLAACGAG
jgi:hypothetical protein